MSPLESRNEDNLSRVRFFGEGQLNRDVAKQKWDRVRLVCSQPFNKRTKYGLSFLALSSPAASAAANDAAAASTSSSKSASPGKTKKLGAFTLRLEEDQSGGGGPGASEDDGGLRLGSAFAKWRKEIGSAQSSSPAAELKSDVTLASLALGRERSQAEDRPMFYQLKKTKEKAASRKRESKKEDGGGSSRGNSRKRSAEEGDSARKKKLPRRDVLPGEEEDESLADSPRRSKDHSSRKDRRDQPTDRSRAKKKTDPAAAAAAPPPTTRPFNRLMEDVVFVLSGFQNPLRGNLRQAAIEMGARYRGDWDGTCTHLVCAFPNTPKFQQVRRAGGRRIVRKEWVEECRRDRKRYPWRRYCLDRADGKGAESEEEVWDEELVPSSSSSRRAVEEAEEEEELDTDEEIERVRAANKKSEDVGKESEDSDAAYDADTDVDEPATPAKGKGEERRDRGGGSKKRNGTASPSDEEDFPALPEFFRGEYFFLYGAFSSRWRKHLNRLVVGAGGSVSPYMGPEVGTVLTDRAALDEELEEAVRGRGRGRCLAVVRPEYVRDCWESGRRLSADGYALKRKMITWP